MNAHRFFVAALLLVATWLGERASGAVGPEQGHPVVRNFTPRDYRADPLCQAVMQDNDGVLLVANNTDALAYDGSTWQWIDLPEESAGIMQFARTEDGTIYAGGGNVLGFFEGPVGQKNFVSLLDRLPPGETNRSFSIAAAGRSLYCAGEDRVLLWREGRFTTVPYPADLRAATLLATHDAVFATAAGAPLYRLAGEGFERCADDPRLREDEVVAIERAAGSDTALEVLTAGHGYFRIEHGDVRPSLPAANRWLAGKQVRRQCRVAGGRRVLAFQAGAGNGGLCLEADGSYAGPLDESIGLLNRALRDFYPDREGGLWIGLESGLARVEWPSAVSVFDAVNGLHGFVTEIARHEGVLYASTIEGLHRLEPPAAAGRPARFAQIYTGPVYSVLSHRGDLLVRGRAALYRLENSGLIPIATHPSSIGNLFPAKNDPRRVWFNTIEGVQSVYRTDLGWRDEGRLAGISDHVTGLSPLPDGSLWVTTYNHGVIHVRFPNPDAPHAAPPQLELFAAGRGLPEGVEHIGLGEWRGEPLFSFNNLARPYRFDAAEHRFAPVPGAAALTSEMRFDCWSSSASGDSFWFTNNSPRQGAHVIYRLRELRGAPQYLPHFIPELSGKIWQLREEMSGGERTLWICGANGLVRVALDQVFQPPVRYATVLRADGVSDGQRLPPLREPLEFEFAAPRFQNRAPVEFQTRLAGYDRTWLPWSADRKRAFNQLSAGDYTFEVRARDADGQLSAPAALSFSVLPAWWRTWWCATLEVLAVITAVAAATRWLAQRALKRRLARLEAESAVERERLRLARDLHDEVGSGLGRVILFAGEAERMKTDPGQLDAALGRVRDTAQELVQHAREIVWAVTPQNDTVGSLIERLGDYADQVLRAAGIACRFELDPNPPPLPLSSEARHSLFLAVKEALHNTLKYAAATEVRLEARVVAGCLTIVLADNGCGFAPGERRGSGHGLGNIAARAEALGGSAEIVSEVGKGTRVTLRVPIAGST